MRTYTMALRCRPVRKQISLKSSWLLALLVAALGGPIHWAQAQIASPFPWLQSIDPDMTGLPPQTAPHGVRFGHSVAIWNDFLLVGAPNTVSTGFDGTIRERGRIHQFRRAGDQWVPDQVLEPSYGEQLNGYCGRSVAMAGGIRAYGCPGVNQVVVSRHDGESFGQQMTTFLPGTQYGHSLSVTGSQESMAFVAAGAPTMNGGLGGVRVLRWTAANASWQSNIHVEPQNPIGLERFGESVSISRAGLGSQANVRMAVGAPHAQQSRGAVYIFEYTSDGQWNQIARITAPNAQMADQFGQSVAHRTSRTPGATGSLLFVGANYRHTGGDTSLDHRRGTVSVYRSVGTTYHYEGDVALVCVLPPCTEQQQMNFGRSLALQGDYVYIGAPSYNQGSDLSVGRVYRAERISNTWVATASYSPGSLSSDCGNAGTALIAGSFGSSLAASPHALALGYPGRGCQHNTSPPEPRLGQVRVFGIMDGVFIDRFE